MLTRTALAAIWGYQQFLSPRKGYACAYRVMHGGTGCSGFAKATIRETGLLRALPEIRARFAACHLAAEALREEKSKSKQTRWYDGCDCSSCQACDPPGCHRGGHATCLHGCDLQPDCCHF